MLTRYLEAVDTDRDAARIIFFELHGVSKELEEVYLAGRARFRRLLIPFLQPMLDGALLDELDPEILAVALVGALVELTRAWLKEEIDVTHEELVEQLLAIVSRFAGL